MLPQRANIFREKEWFRVLVTTKRTQTAVMKLGLGQSTGEEAEAHENSDQVLLVVEGELLGRAQAAPYENWRYGRDSSRRKTPIYE